MISKSKKEFSKAATVLEMFVIYIVSIYLICTDRILYGLLLLIYSELLTIVYHLKLLRDKE